MLQEQGGPVAVSRILSSQGDDINSGRGADGNPGQRGGSGRRSTPTRAETTPEEALREQPQSALEPRLLSSQNSNINVGEIAGASLGNKGGSDRCLAYVSPLTLRRAYKATH